MNLKINTMIENEINQLIVSEGGPYSAIQSVLNMNLDIDQTSKIFSHILSVRGVNLEALNNIFTDFSQFNGSDHIWYYDGGNLFYSSIENIIEI